MSPTVHAHAHARARAVHGVEPDLYAYNIYETPGSHPTMVELTC